jgi:molybdopterin-guanine dinucleotide biosynthesis protein A
MKLSRSALTPIGFTVSCAMPTTESTCGVVLAGGYGHRLGGVNKALLDIGGSTNIARVLTALEPICTDLTLVANDATLSSLPGIRLVRDTDPHAGVLPALAQGLEAADGSLAIVVACDMPFLNRGLLAELLRRATVADVVIPLVGGRLEPMHAIYRRAPALEAIHSALATGERRMTSFLNRLRVDRVEESIIRSFDPELHSFFNINTPEDLERARALAATGS